MHIQKGIEVRKGVWQNETVEKVSQASINNTVWLSSAEVTDADFIKQFNALLPKGLVLVVPKLLQFNQNGNIRCFIGSTDYVRLETVLA